MRTESVIEFFFFFFFEMLQTTCIKNYLKKVNFRADLISRTTSFSKLSANIARLINLSRFCVDYISQLQSIQKHEKS